MKNAAKNTGAHSQLQSLILSVLLAPIVALSSFGCFDDFDYKIDFSGNVDLTEKFIWGAYGPTARMRIAIDSANQMNDSTIRLFVKLSYDSVVIRSAYGVSYVKTGDTLELIKIFSAKADTLDFRKLPNMNYSYHLDLDSLESKVNYTFCPFMDYIVKGDTIRILRANLGGSCLYFETK